MEMKNYEKELRQRIYELMIGEYDIEHHPVKESSIVINEFAKGMPCAILYDEIFRAKENICRRLGNSEDSDIERIISNFLDILNYMSNKMYEYGVLFAKQEKKETV